jgi:DNA-binding response OmpR family regulator
MNGIVFIRKLREEFSKVPVIILSAKSDKVSVREGLESGANAFLEKPCDIESLLQTINQSLVKWML